jgi:hypothetical protein
VEHPNAVENPMAAPGLGAGQAVVERFGLIAAVEIVGGEILPESGFTGYPVLYFE